MWLLLVFIVYLRYWSSGEVDVSAFGKALCCHCNFMVVKLRGLDLPFQKLSKHAVS